MAAKQSDCTLGLEEKINGLIEYQLFIEKCLNCGRL